MGFAVRLLALSCAIAIVGAAPQPDQLAAVAAANGHPALVHLRAVGRRTIEGRQVETTFDQFGTRRLVRRCVAGVCGGSWFDGTREWTFGLNEIALPEAPDEVTLTLRTLAAIACYGFAEPGFRAGGGTVAADGPGRWRVRAPDALELVAVVDPASKALRRVETPGGRIVATYGREARSAGGATFALDRSGAFEHAELDEVSAAAGALAAPAGIASAVTGEAALPLTDDPVPIVPCTLGGRSVRCLLDSGATPSAMTLGLAETLGLEPHGELEISGFARFATGFVDAGPLVLGPARFERARWAVIPQTSAAHFDVVVGSDLLARMRVVFDRGQRVARIGPPGTAAATGTRVRLAFHAGSPIVQTMVGPQGAPALLDTGDQSVLSIGYAAYREGPQWPVISRGRSIGVAGSDDVFTVDVPTLEVGALTVGPTRASVRRTQGLAHVGIGLWDRYVVDLDEQAERVTFSPR